MVSMAKENLPLWQNTTYGSSRPKLQNSSKATYCGLACRTILQLSAQYDSKDLFCNMQKAHHCLFDILPVENVHDHELRERGHNFVLIQCNSNIFKASFLNRYLFTLISFWVF